MAIVNSKRVGHATKCSQLCYANLTNFSGEKNECFQREARSETGLLLTPETFSCPATSSVSLLDCRVFHSFPFSN